MPAVQHFRRLQTDDRMRGEYAVTAHAVRADDAIAAEASAGEERRADPNPRSLADKHWIAGTVRLLDDWHVGMGERVIVVADEHSLGHHDVPLDDDRPRARHER